MLRDHGHVQGRKAVCHPGERWGDSGGVRGLCGAFLGVLCSLAGSLASAESEEAGRDSAESRGLKG